MDGWMDVHDADGLVRYVFYFVYFTPRLSLCRIAKNGEWWTVKSWEGSGHAKYLSVNTSSYPTRLYNSSTHQCENIRSLKKQKRRYSHITVSWNMTPCVLVLCTNVEQEHTASNFRFDVLKTEAPGVSKTMVQGGSNMTGTNCDLFIHKSSRSCLNHLVFM